MNDAPTQGHNAADRHRIIREVIADLDRIDGEIAELQAERTKIKNQRIKGDLGVKLTDFAVLRRFHGLEDDERTRLFDTLREGFKALNIGDQGSFLQVLGNTEVVGHAAAKPKTKFDAENLGIVAGEAGCTEDDMPNMPAKKGFQTAWLTGLATGQAKRAKLEAAQHDAAFDERTGPDDDSEQDDPIEKADALV